MFWFLREHRGLGYSSFEIAAELGALDIIYSVEEVEAAAGILIGKDMVEAGEVSGVIYFRYYRRFGFRPPRR